MRPHSSILILAALLASSANGELVCQVGILTSSTLSRWHPHTFQPWKAGDTYRLVFQTSVGHDALSSNIEVYNNWVQSLADASPLKIGSAQGLIWKVIGSTDTVDARDNTSTNPNLDGLGCPIYQLDGSSVVASSYPGLWDKVAGPIRITELGVANYNAVWPFTGTFWDGTKATGKSQSFSALGGMELYGTGGANGRQIGQAQGGYSDRWIWRLWTATSPTNVHPMYAISQELTVVDNAAPIRLTLEQSDSNFALKWNSKPGKVYDLVSSPTLGTNPATWSVHSDEGGIYGGMNRSVTGTNSITVQPSGERGFFSIVERDVDVTSEGASPATSPRR